MKTDYEAQAEKFLADNGIKFRATLSDSKCPPWTEAGTQFGHHYRVTLWRGSYPGGSEGVPNTERNDNPKGRLTFDFWGSVADQKAGKHITAYDVLACISSDANAPESFEDYCSDFGESTDSIKAKQTFTRLSRFAKRLRAFFTESELEQLAEIQ